MGKGKEQQKHSLIKIVTQRYKTHTLLHNDNRKVISKIVVLTGESVNYKRGELKEKL